MGCKGKGKAVERALHRAERQEEWAAECALARGDISSAIAHAQKAEVLEHAEHAVHWKGKGKGKGYRHAADVVVAPLALACAKGSGKALESALQREELREQRIAGACLVHGDVAGASTHAERARELHTAERAVHHEVVHAKAHEAHRRERWEEHLAARDLAHGNILGALSHEAKAAVAHQRGDRLENELSRDHRDHHHTGWRKGKGMGVAW